MQRLLFFFRGCVECPASVGGNIFCIKRLTSPSLCLVEASLEFDFAVLLSGSACTCVCYGGFHRKAFVFPSDKQMTVLKQQSNY